MRSPRSAIRAVRMRVYTESTRDPRGIRQSEIRDCSHFPPAFVIEVPGFVTELRRGGGASVGKFSLANNRATGLY